MKTASSKYLRDSHNAASSKYNSAHQNHRPEDAEIKVAERLRLGCYVELGAHGHGVRACVF